MRKSNIPKTAFVLVLMAVMFVTTAITAFAYNDGTAYADEPQTHSNDDEQNGNDNDQGEDYDNGNGNGNGNGGYVPPTTPPVEPPVEPPAEPPIQTPPLGSLVIINSTHEGQLLHGAVFAVYRVGEPTRLAELATNTHGRTLELPLSYGEYSIVLIIPAHGHMGIVDRINTTITAGQRQEITIFSVPVIPQTPEPTPPAIETGRILITLRAQGTNQLLNGAIFELRRAMDGEVVAHLITDMFGEAVFDLPIGDYFLREIQNVSGFIPNPDRVNVRIAANRLTEVNLTSRPEPAPTPPQTQTPPPQEQAPQAGRLIVTLTADGTREPLAGAIFEVRRAIDNSLMAEIITDRFGEAAINLSPDDYFLRQITTAQGFEFSTERLSVRIATGAVREIPVTNHPTAPITPPQEETPPAEVLRGRLLIDVVSAGTNERIEGAVFAIHDVMTEELVATVLSNAFGEVSLLLPAGNFFVRNTAMPQGYHRNVERINFTIRAEAVTNMTITARAVEVEQPTPTPEPQPTPTSEPAQTPTAITPPAQRPTTTAPTQAIPVTTPSQIQTNQRRVEISTRAEQSGNPLHGATFVVYRAIDSQRMGEVTTDMNGRATISLSAGEYYLRNTSVQFGFLQERVRIFFTVTNNSNVNVEVTIQRDGNIPYVDYGFIVLPATGELTPIMNYVLGSAFLALSLLCLVGILKQRKPHYNPRKGVKSYA